ncbi:phage tail assembly chaperone [Massilia oculi]|uniref:Phage tail assembly chaperone n=1 Tax=Massilia hydrophila TaxID=3044279 RepID=A0ABS7YCM9_9BURK|nr:phage tail assembly chaperone [Massilia oculi]MCA1857455.1 phage tail assembly chaperone [Massilia oculi]
MAKANKIVLGKRPETFSKEVSFPMLDGSTGCIRIDYLYRTRKEHAAFIDSIQAGIEAKAKSESERYKALADAGEDLPMLKQSDVVSYQVEANVDTIMGAVKGWNLDIPFDREAVEQLVDELPAAVAAILTAYREAITEGRLGNSV